MRFIFTVTVVVIFAILGTSFLIDSYSAQAVRVEVSMVPEVLPADGTTPGTIKVLVYDPSGTPRSGDVIELFVKGRASLNKIRTLTDDQGQATFQLVVARSNRFAPATPVEVNIVNISLGSLVEVRKSVIFIVDVIEPSE